MFRLVTGNEYTVLNGYSTLSYVPDFTFSSKFAQDWNSLYSRYKRNPASGLVLVYPEENIIYIFSKVGRTYLAPSWWTLWGSRPPDTWWWGRSRPLRWSWASLGCKANLKNSNIFIVEWVSGNLLTVSTLRDKIFFEGANLKGLKYSVKYAFGGLPLIHKQTFLLPHPYYGEFSAKISALKYHDPKKWFINVYLYVCCCGLSGFKANKKLLDQFC